MKTAMKKVFTITLLLLALTVSANNETELKGKRVKVEFNAVKKGETITIKSENGATVYSKQIEKNGKFSKIFDLSGLENGNYTAELEKQYEIIVKSFKVSNGVVFEFNNKNKTIYKPVVRTEGDLLLLSKINFNKDALKVSLYYKDELILDEKVASEKNIFKRVYKLSKEQWGDYKIVVKTKNRSFVQDFIM